MVGRREDREERTTSISKLWALVEGTLPTAEQRGSFRSSGLPAEGLRGLRAPCIYRGAVWGGSKSGLEGSWGVCSFETTAYLGERDSFLLATGRPAFKNYLDNTMIVIAIFEITSYEFAFVQTLRISNTLYSKPHPTG